MTNFKVVAQKTNKFGCFTFTFTFWKNGNLKKIFSKGYFRIIIYTFVLNFKVVGQKTAELWLFYVLNLVT